jgi:hypothetical protein
MTVPHIRPELIPWEDATFVQEFERARDHAIEGSRGRTPPRVS